MQRHGIGIIGAGSIGRVHIQACGEVPELEVVALAESVPGRGDALAAELGIPKAVTDYRDLLALPEVDAVIICLPNFLHAPVTIAALEAGKHVLCEKPLTTSAEDARAVLAAEEASGRRVMVALQYRYGSDARWMREAVVNGELGEIYSVRAAFLRRSGIPGWGGWFTNKQRAGGGVLVDVGVHILDTTMFVLGYPRPLAVTAATRAAFGPRRRGLGGWAEQQPDGVFDVEDWVGAHIRLEGDLTLDLEASWAGFTETAGSYIYMRGTEGGVALDGAELRAFSERYGNWVESRVQVPDRGDLRIRMIRDFLGVLQGGDPPVSANHGLVLAQIFDAVYESARTGREALVDG